MWNRTAYILLLAAFLSMASCRNRDGGAEERREVSVSYLKSLYKGHPRLITEDYKITGNVVSSDRFGNFYKVLVIEDGTGGIEIKVDMKDLFKVYERGAEVEVSCKSLTLGAYGQLVQLGTEAEGGYETGYIPEQQAGWHINVTGRKAGDLRPLLLEIDGIRPSHICRSVAFDNVRFTEAGGGAKWCEEGVDTDRTLMDAKGNTLIVRTSSHAEFAGYLLPEGNIYIEGVLSWFNGKYQLKVIEARSAVVEE